MLAGAGAISGAGVILKAGFQVKIQKESAKEPPLSMKALGGSSTSLLLPILVCKGFEYKL